MWQRVFRNRDRNDGAGIHLARKLLWLLPAVVLIMGGAQLVAPAFAATLTVSIFPSTQSPQVGVPVTYSGLVQNPPQGCTDTFTFTFSDGIGSTSGTNSTAAHTFVQAGTYTVTLTVVDNCNNSGAAQLPVTVTGQGTGGFPGSCTPTAGSPITATVTPGSQTANVGATLTIAGAAGGATGSVNYSFNFGDGGSMAGQVVSHAYSTAGTFTVTLTVTDQAGRTGCGVGTVTVTGSGGTTGTCTATPGGIIAASINPASQSAAVGATLNFTGVASGTAGSTTYLFNFGDGSTASGTSVTHAYGTAGTFPVTLTVTDQTGRIGCAVATANISGTSSGTGTTSGSNPNIRVAPNGPYTGVPNQPVNFGGFAQTFNQGATITGYQWNFGDNTATGSGQFVSHTYTAAGSFTVTLTVTDSSGQSSSATTIATIGGSTTGGTTGNTTGSTTSNGVTANTGGPYSGASGAPVAFNTSASTSNANASINSCVISFGDNSTSAPCQGATHIYNTNGSYTAVITVTDSSGAVAAASTTVTVTGGNRTVNLVAGCNNVSSTFADGTSTGTLASAVSPQATVLSVWKLADPATARYRGYFPGATQASDLPTVNRLDAIFICVNASATFSEPSA